MPTLTKKFWWLKWGRWPTPAKAPEDIVVQLLPTEVDARLFKDSLEVKLI